MFVTELSHVKSHRHYRHPLKIITLSLALSHTSPLTYVPNILVGYLVIEVVMVDKVVNVVKGIMLMSVLV
jgi:hypothetical protein